LVLIAEKEMEAPDALPNLPTTRLGFLVARHVASEWELENIVVAASARRMGVGRRLLEALVAWAIQTKSESVLLEVRESNVAARRLYERLEFQEAGRRKWYYGNPSEDAILYTRRL
jgi:ribosomal-protein-alanine N-acetyltransferase